MLSYRSFLVSISFLINFISRSTTFSNLVYLVMSCVGEEELMLLPSREYMENDVYTSRDATINTVEVTGHSKP